MMAFASLLCCDKPEDAMTKLHYDSFARHQQRHFCQITRLIYILIVIDNESKSESNNSVD